MRRVHEFKTWPEPYEAVRSGRKRYEIRVDDRDYAVGDLLTLREWNPETKLYTGRMLSRHVEHKTSGGEWGLPPNLCVLGLGAA